MVTKQKTRPQQEADAWWEGESFIPGLTRDGLVKVILFMILAVLFVEEIDWNHLDAFQTGWWATLRSLL